MTKHFALDEGDIHVTLNGATEAPPLLLIHGSASSSRSWDPMVPLLAGSHRIDLLGHGQSAWPIGPSYEVPDQSRRVATVLVVGPSFRIIHDGSQQFQSDAQELLLLSSASGANQDQIVSATAFEAEACRGDWFSLFTMSTGDWISSEKVTSCRLLDILQR